MKLQPYERRFLDEIDRFTDADFFRWRRVKRNFRRSNFVMRWRMTVQRRCGVPLTNEPRIEIKRTTKPK